jgi:uncharacterized protein YeeX (DUF496 family)
MDLKDVATMARNDSESGRKSPDYLTQMINSTFNDGSESPPSSPSNDSAFLSPSLADEIFSPSHSIVTDITDDYGWETPVKEAPTSPSTNEYILGSSQNKIQDELKGTEGLSKEDKGFDTQSQSPASRRTRSATRHKFRPSISSLGSVDTSVTLLDKRKEVSDSPVDGNALVFGQGQIWQGSITPPKPKTPKLLRQTEFWTLGQNGQIDLTFATDQMWLIKARARAVSDVGSAMKATPDPVVSCTEKQDDDQSPPPPPATRSIPDISISPPEDDQTGHKIGDAHTPSSRRVVLGDGTIQDALSLLSTQSFSASAKDQTSNKTSLSKIMPIEIRERLEEDTHHCSAWGTRGWRCKRRHESNRSQITQCLDNMTKIKCSQLPKYLNDLIPTALCSATHQRLAREELKKWMADIEKLCEIHTDVKETTSQVSADHRLLALANWIDILSGGKGFSQKQGIAVSSLLPAKVEESNPSVISQGYRLLQYFKPYITKNLQNVSVPQALEKLLLEPIRKKNEIKKVGIIYVYWQPGNFGHLKIGYTTQDLSKRMKQWNSQCNKTMEVYFPDRNDEQELIPVRHVCRVEKLVHMELKNLRRIEQNCPGCGKNHNEWFEVSRDLAVEVVRKWMAWMRESPYEKRLDEWVLKAEQRSKIKALSEPLKGVSVTAQAMEKGWSKQPRQARRLSTGRLPRMRSKSM